MNDKQLEVIVKTPDAWKLKALSLFVNFINWVNIPVFHRKNKDKIVYIRIKIIIE